jgi:two-component system sensor histidine kinase KdpD
LLHRRPEVALVDELAHSNAPGSRHERRYQDVEELLDAGIDVYSTLNVQHLESLNDVVEQITGVRVRETVPDAFFDRPHEIVLIDLPPRELIERLRQGKVYVPEQARTALQSFFSPVNLAALRELAMQTAADRVDADLREYLLAHGAPQGAPIRRRVLVAVDDQAHAEYLVRVARRIAERLQAPWTVAYVDTGAGSRTDRDKLHAALPARAAAGRQTVTLRGANVVEELLSYAGIVTASRRSSSAARGSGRSPASSTARSRSSCCTRGARFELTIVNTPLLPYRGRAAGWPGSSRTGARTVTQYGLATSVSVVAVVLCAVLDLVAPAGEPGAGVPVRGPRRGRVRSRTSVSIYAAVLCFLAYNFFFTEPAALAAHHQRRSDLVPVLAFLAAALVCGQLAPGSTPRS